MTDIQVARTASPAEVNDRIAEFNDLFTADQPELTSEQVQAQILAQILSQNTAEGVLAPRATVSSKDYVGQPFTLLGYEMRESDYAAEGPPRYMVLRCVNADGEPFTMTSGSVNVMGAAWHLSKLDAVPCKVVIKRAEKPSKDGYYALRLEASPDF